MRYLYTFLAGVLLIAGLAACQNSGADSTKPDTASTAPAKPAGPTDADVKRISIDEARAAVEKGTAIIVDVRPADQYKSSHIKGSISIPINEIDKRSGELPKGKTAILYCSWGNEHTSAGAALILLNKGMTNTAALLGGTNVWMQRGLPMVSGDQP